MENYDDTKHSKAFPDKFYIYTSDLLETLFRSLKRSWDNSKNTLSYTENDPVWKLNDSPGEVLNMN